MRVRQPARFERFPGRLRAGGAFELSQRSGYRTINPETFLDFSLHLTMEQFHETDLPTSNVVVNRHLGHFVGAGGGGAVEDTGSVWAVKGLAPEAGKWRWRLEWRHGPDCAIADPDSHSVSVVKSEVGLLEVVDDGAGAPDWPLATVQVVDGALCHPDGAPFVARNIVDLTQRAAFAQSGALDRVGVGPEVVALVDPLAGAPLWRGGRLFALDPASIDAAAEAAILASEAGATVGVSLMSVTRAGEGARDESEAIRAERLLVREIVARFGSVAGLVWLAPEEFRHLAFLGEIDPASRPVLNRLPSVEDPRVGAAQASARSSAKSPEGETDAANGRSSESQRDARRPVAPPAASLSSSGTEGSVEFSDEGRGKPEADESVSSEPPRHGVVDPRAGRAGAPSRPVRRWLGDGVAGDARGGGASGKLDPEGRQGMAAGASSGRAEPSVSEGRPTERISLSSFWPRPGKQPDRKGDDAAPRQSAPVDVKGEQALEVLLYRFEENAFETATRIDARRPLDLEDLIESGARLAVRIDGTGAEKAREIALTIEDASGQEIQSLAEPYREMAVFGSLEAPTGMARVLRIQAISGGGGRPLQEWSIACLQNAAEPSGELKKAPRSAGAPGVRLERIDFIDPETDRLEMVWREGGARPGPMPDLRTMTVSVSGEDCARVSHAIATLEIDGMPPTRLEASPIVEVGKATCVFYNLEMRGVARSLIVDLFDNADASEPFARLNR